MPPDITPSGVAILGILMCSKPSETILSLHAIHSYVRWQLVMLCRQANVVIFAGEVLISGRVREGVQAHDVDLTHDFAL